MEDNDDRRLPPSGRKGMELKQRDDYSLSTEIRREYFDPSVEEDLNIRDYLDVIIRQKWLVLTCLVISLVVGIVLTLKSEKLFRAIATIEIAPETPKITSFEEIGSRTVDIREFYETQYRLIKSKYLARDVMDALSLDSDPLFVGSKSNGVLSSIKSKFSSPQSTEDTQKSLELMTQKEQIAREEGLIQFFLSRLNVVPDTGSRLVQIAFDSPYPEIAAKTANTVVDRYIEWILERKLGTTKGARQFLERQIEQSKVKLEQSEEDLGKFAKSVDIVSLDRDLNLVFKQLAELNDSLAKAETDRLSKEALYGQIQSGSFDYLPQILNDPATQGLNAEYAKLKGQYDNLAVVYGPNFPELKQIAAQIGRVESEIEKRKLSAAEGIKKDYETAVQRERILRQRNDQQKLAAADQNEKAIQYKIIEREVNTNKEIYDNLLQKLKETEVTADIRATNVQVVDYAFPPLVPYKPDVKYNLLYSIIIGLMSGIALCFVLEQFNTTIKDEDEIKRRFAALPFLGTVPLRADGDRGAIEKTVHINPRSIISEAFRVIRTSILYSSPNHPPRSILVTSTQPMEGKTTSASNLSLAMVQSGLRVVLIDGDMRRPRIHKIFFSNAPNAIGLSSYLVGKIELKDVVAPSGIEGLSIISSGPIPPNPAELLGSKRMVDMIAALLEEFDHVIIDAPPVLAFADSRLLASAVDGVLIVTSVGITQKQWLKTCIEDIIKVRGRIIGAIVNRFESGRSKYGYGYYYYYGEGDERKRKKKFSPTAKVDPDNFHIASDMKKRMQKGRGKLASFFNNRRDGQT
ncbi:MAG: GumC family protein [Deltaproteobacteria bacterium]